MIEIALMILSIYVIGIAVVYVVGFIGLAFMKDEPTKSTNDEEESMSIRYSDDY